MWRYNFCAKYKSYVTIKSKISPKNKCSINMTAFNIQLSAVVCGMRHAANAGSLVNVNILWAINLENLTFLLHKNGCTENKIFLFDAILNFIGYD